MWTIAAFIVTGVLSVLVALGALYRLRIRQKGWPVAVVVAVFAGGAYASAVVVIHRVAKRFAVDLGKDDRAVDILAGAFLIIAAWFIYSGAADSLRRYLPTKRERWLKAEIARLYDRR